MADVLLPTGLGCTGLTVSGLGLGCSHIASLSTRPGAAEIARLLDAAWESGLRLFDTADLYGQGDSERRLARIAARPGAVICTKAGLALKTGQTATRLLKPVLRPVLRLTRSTQPAASLRAVSEIHDLDPRRLIARLEGSLRRLRQDRVAVFLLHSPPRALLADGALFDTLDRIRDRGLAGAVGVSCQTPEDGAWVLAQRRVQVLQIPLQAGGLAGAGPLLDAAAAQGTGVIAREVLGGTDPASALPPLLADARVHVTLCGTTDLRHLGANIAIARGTG